MTRQHLIEAGRIKPPPPPGSPTPQRWRDEPTLRLRDIDRVRMRDESRKEGRP